MYPINRFTHKQLLIKQLTHKPLETIYLTTAFQKINAKTMPSQVIPLEASKN